MAIAFRTPHEGIEKYERALDLMKVIQDIVKNPDVHATIKSLSKEIVETHTLSDEKKKELIQAEEIIAQSKEFLEDFAKAKKNHADLVKEETAALEIARVSYEREMKKFQDERRNSQDNLEKQFKLADQKLEDAKQLVDSSKRKHQEIQDLKSATESSIIAHEKTVRQFLEDKKAAELELDAKVDAHENVVKKHNETVAAFELRKKRFEDALRG